VKPVPDELAPNYTGGRYNPGAVGAAGEYWVNTYALDKRPLYVLPALTLHEAVPGHHLQGALARELAGVLASGSTSIRTPSARAGACTLRSWARSSACTTRPTSVSVA